MPNIWKNVSKIVHILIKITQCHFLVTTFLQNRTTDFDETLHVAWVCLCEGFGNSGRSGCYSLIQKKGGQRPPYPCESPKLVKRLQMSPNQNGIKP